MSVQDLYFFFLQFPNLTLRFFFKTCLNKGFSYRTLPSFLMENLVCIKVILNPRMCMQLSDGNDILLKSKTEASKTECSWVLNISFHFEFITLFWQLSCICGEHCLSNKNHTASKAKLRWKMSVIFSLITSWYICCCYSWIGKKSPKDKSQLPQKQIHYLLETKMCL